MSQLAALGSRTVTTLVLNAEAGSVRLSGSITFRDPSTELAPVLRAVHEAAVADGVERLAVDVRELTFVNSSAIRCFVDWAMWAQGGSGPYVLEFHTHPETTWQRTTFNALRSIAPRAVEIRH